MTRNQSRNQSPVQIVLSDSFYEIATQRRADENARLASQGLPPTDDESPFISESQAKAEAEAEAKQRASKAAQKAAASLAPPPPTRGPLCRAAKAKVAERIAAIPGFERHSRKCQICRSPYVDDIEQLYLQWERVDLICRYFQLADADAVYRHARAAGLDVLRRQNSRWVVEQFIEQWRTVKITSSTVIRSIRALSCLDEKGRWTDLPKTHILVRGTDAPPDSAASSSGPPESDSATSSTGQPVAATTASDTGIPQGGSDEVSVSCERSEPYSGRGSVGSSQPRGDVPFSSESSLRGQSSVLSSFERSEPHCGRDSGLPSEVVTSVTHSPEAAPTVLVPSTERSEPHGNPSADSLATSHSTLATGRLRRPNRVSTGN